MTLMESIEVEMAEIDDEVEKLAILDFGAQYGKVIDRKVRECNVHCDLLPFDTTREQLIAGGYKAVIISGGPDSVYTESSMKCDINIFNGDLPVLGICYGFQLINQAFSGAVSPQVLREDGQVNLQIDNSSPIFYGLEENQTVLLTHGDGVTVNTLAPNFKIISKHCHVVTGISHIERKIYGLQFHPEVDLTENGKTILMNYLTKVATFRCNYTIENREQLCIERIKKDVGDRNVLVMISGGVDSTVCAYLLHKALPGRVIAIHIDNGFMRLKESENVVNSLKEIGLVVKKFNYVDDFLNANRDGVDTLPLNRIIDPEEKRMIIGDTFIKCKDFAIDKMGLDFDIFLAQGTLRPDLIESANESASNYAHVIKTHHNDSPLVRKLRNEKKVIEPLSEFHKDEVRDLGRNLGLPDSIIRRHPFPGPGLAIRILCAEEPFMEEHYEETKKAMAEIASEISGNTINASLLPLKTVGVQGDRRSYSYVAALSMNVPSDEKIPWNMLFQIAKVLPNKVHTINRVVYVFGTKIENDITELTPTFINEGTLNQLREADHVATNVLLGLDEDGKPDPHLKEAMGNIQQMPVILIPIHFDRVYNSPQYIPSMCRSICLRPFITKDFMTGRAAIPGIDIPEETILEIVARVKHVPMISRVMIDLTAKPPGTTEWE